jgi:hypothetical protein
LKSMTHVSILKVSSWIRICKFLAWLIIKIDSLVICQIFSIITIFIIVVIDILK